MLWNRGIWFAFRPGYDAPAPPDKTELKAIGSEFYYGIGNRGFVTRNCSPRRVGLLTTEDQDEQLGEDDAQQHGE